MMRLGKAFSRPGVRTVGEGGQESRGMAKDLLFAIGKAKKASKNVKCRRAKPRRKVTSFLRGRRPSGQVTGRLEITERHKEKQNLKNLFVWISGSS